MNLSAPFINRPVMTTFVMLTIVLAGIAAFFELPVSDLPTIERQNIKVETGYTGASSETVLNQVTIPLEKELTHIKGVEEITSKSSPGSSSIDLSFALSKDMNIAIRDVQAALNRAESGMPKEVDSRPTYHLQEGSQEPIMFMILTSDDSSIGELRNYADAYIIPRLERIEGVAQVLTYGPEKSIWLKLNPELMAARKIGFNQVIDAVRQQTEQVPLGSIQTGSKRLSIELPHIVKQAKDIENLKIGQYIGAHKGYSGDQQQVGPGPRLPLYHTREGLQSVDFRTAESQRREYCAVSKAVHEALEGVQKSFPHRYS